MPKTEIIQLVARHPEIPEEMELNRESGKNLAALMREYPTKTPDADAEETEKRREYTCIKCKNNNNQNDHVMVRTRAS